MSKTYKKICYIIAALTLIVGVAFTNQDLRNAVTDAGNTTSHSSGGSSHSSSSHSSSSHSSSSHSSSSHSSSSSSSFSSSGDIDDLPWYIAILVFLFVSIHWTIFAIIPIANLLSKNNKNKVVKYVIILEVIRVAIYAVMFIYSASMAMLVDFIGLFPIAFIVFPIMIKKDSNNVSSYTPSNSIENDYPEVSAEEYELYDIKNVEEFKTQLYKMFYDIEIAWMNFDYGTLKELCTDELYNTYKSQLDTYKVKHQKNIMEDITRIKVRPYKFTATKNLLTARVIIEIEMKDYIIDETNNQVVSGNKTTIYNNTYDFTFVRNIHYIREKCPNCGHDLKEHQGTIKCPYCRSILVNYDDKWHVAEKKNIQQINK